MERVLAIVVTFAVGAAVAAQAPANDQLSKHVGTLGAAFMSLLLSTAMVAVVLAFAGGFGELRDGIGGFRPEHALGAVAGALIVTVSLITVRELGAGGVSAVLVAGQMVLAVVLDRLGVLGLPEIALTPQRLIGAALLIAGTVLIVAR